MGDYIAAAFTGLLIGVALMTNLVVWQASKQGWSHQVGAEQNVCVEIENQVLPDGSHSMRRKCVTGMEIIEWMREAK